jgi:hypothetical protein
MSLGNVRRHFDPAIRVTLESDSKVLLDNRITINDKNILIDKLSITRDFHG